MRVVGGRVALVGLMDTVGSLSAWGPVALAAAVVVAMLGVLLVGGTRLCDVVAKRLWFVRFCDGRIEENRLG